MAWRETIKMLLERRGIVLSRPPGQFNVIDWKLKALKQRGVTFNVILDGGAHEGGWTKSILPIFPDATYVMVEPRDDIQPTLKAMSATNKKLIVIQSLLGASEGQVQFHHDKDRSSILPDATGENFGHLETAQMTTLDRIFETTGLPMPDFIKLDLQGAEVEALKGGTRCLQNAQAVLLELSLMPFQKGQPIFAEVIAFMNDRGFVLYDIPALWHRKLDGALGQGDFFFLRADHPLRRDPRWSLDG